MAMICSVTVPIQMVAPSGEMSALPAPGDVDRSGDCARLIGRGENLDSIHGAVGDEEVMVCGVVGHVPVTPFAGRVVG